ncbi:MAG: hypothetical protein GXN98_04390 [Euryarchaeota archaeon]|nr:hypothetical protein [Euryarchaeota archaeon]
MMFYDIETTGLEPRIDRIISVAFMDIDGRLLAYACDADEKSILEIIALTFMRYRHATFVGWNNKKFDDNFILIRMNEHELPNECREAVQHAKKCDLMIEEWVYRGGKGRYHKLYEVCRRYNVSPPKGKGRNMPKYYKNGEWSKIFRHNLEDVAALRELYITFKQMGIVK